MVNNGTSKMTLSQLQSSLIQLANIIESDPTYCEELKKAISNIITMARHIEHQAKLAHTGYDNGNINIDNYNTIMYTLLS